MKPRPAMVLVLVLLPACAATYGRAQAVSSSIDLGGTRMRFADTLTTSAAVVTPSIHLRWPRVALGAAGSFSQLQTGGWTTQGSLSGSALTAPLGAASAEFSALAGGSAHQDGSRTGQLLGTVRAHLMGSAAGAWVGAGAGAMSDGILWRAVLQAEAGAWARMGSSSLVASATPTAVDDTIRYTDMLLALSTAGSHVDLLASAGTRSGAHVPSLGGSATTWGSASVVIWFARNTGLVLSAGTYPVDLTQGFPGGQFASISVRFGAHAATNVVRAEDARRAGSRAAAEIQRAAESGVAEFRVIRVNGNRRQLRVRAPSATAVALMGDFTSWQPLPLSRGADGWWTADTDLEPGVHQLNLRVDGGMWIVPPGLTTMIDEFGGAVGLLVIEGGT